MSRHLRLALGLSILFHFVFFWVLNRSPSISERISMQSTTSWMLEGQRVAVTDKVSEKVGVQQALHKQTGAAEQSVNQEILSRQLNEVSASKNSYLSKLQAMLESKKVYPKRALMKGEQGTVNISFSITASGKFESIEIIQGSRFEELDQAALQLVKKSAFFEPLPAELLPRLQVSLPIVFKTVR